MNRTTEQLYMTIYDLFGTGPAFYRELREKKTTAYVSTATLQHKNRIRDIFHTKQVYQALPSFLQEKLWAHTTK